MVTPYVSIFAEINLTPASPPKRNNGHSSFWNVGHVLKTAWKWSSWSLIWAQDGTNVSFISHIHVHFLSCLISLIVLLTLPLLSSAVMCLKSILPQTKYCKILHILMAWGFWAHILKSLDAFGVYKSLVLPAEVYLCLTQ